jgi:aspartate/glutamate racemase
VIYDELCRGLVLDESRRAYLEVIDRLVSPPPGCTSRPLSRGRLA